MYRYVDDIAEIVVESSEDIIRLCDQGNRIQKLTSVDENELTKYYLYFI